MRSDDTLRPVKHRVLFEAPGHLEVIEDRYYVMPAPFVMHRGRMWSRGEKTIDLDGTPKWHMAPTPKEGS